MITIANRDHFYFNFHKFLINIRLRLSHEALTLKMNVNDERNQTA